MGGTQSTTIKVKVSDSNLRSAGGADNTVSTEIVSKKLETETISVSSCTDVDNKSDHTVIKRQHRKEIEYSVSTKRTNPSEKHVHALQRLAPSEIKRLVQRGSGISVASSFDSCDNQVGVKRNESSVREERSKRGDQTKSESTPDTTVSEAEEAIETPDTTKSEEETIVTEETTETTEEESGCETTEVPVIHNTARNSIVGDAPALVCSKRNVRPIAVIVDEELESDVEESDESEEQLREESSEEGHQNQIKVISKKESSTEIHLYDKIRDLHYQEKDNVELVCDRSADRRLLDSCRISYRARDKQAERNSPHISSSAVICSCDPSNKNPCVCRSPNTSVQSRSVFELHRNENTCICDEYRKLTQNRFTGTPCTCKYSKSKFSEVCKNQPVATCLCSPSTDAPCVCDPKSSGNNTASNRPIDTDAVTICLCGQKQPCICDLSSSSKSVYQVKRKVSPCSSLRREVLCLCHKEKNKCICGPTQEIGALKNLRKREPLSGPSEVLCLCHKEKNKCICGPTQEIGALKFLRRRGPACEPSEVSTQTIVICSCDKAIETCICKSSTKKASTTDTSYTVGSATSSTSVIDHKIIIKNSPRSSLRKEILTLCNKEKAECTYGPNREILKNISARNPAPRPLEISTILTPRKTTKSDATTIDDSPKVSVKSRVKSLSERIIKVVDKSPKNSVGNKLTKLQSLNSKNNSPRNSKCVSPCAIKKTNLCDCCKTKNCTCIRDSRKTEKRENRTPNSRRSSVNASCIYCQHKDLCKCEPPRTDVASTIEKLNEKLSKTLARGKRNLKGLEKAGSRRSSAKKKEPTNQYTCISIPSNCKQKTEDSFEPLEIISTLVSNLPKYDCPKPVLLDIEVFPKMNHPNGLKPNQHKVVVKSYAPPYDKYCENKSAGDIHSRVHRFSSDVDRRQYRNCYNDKCEDSDDWDTYFEPDQEKDNHVACKHMVSPRMPQQSYLPPRVNNASQECNCSCTCCGSMKDKRPEIPNRTLQNGSQTTPSLYESRGASPINCNCCKCRTSSPARCRAGNCNPVHMDRSTNTSQNNLYRAKRCGRSESAGNCRFACPCNKYSPSHAQHYESTDGPRYNMYSQNDYDPPNTPRTCNCDHCLRNRNGMRQRDYDKLPYEKHQKYGDLVNELQHELGSRNATNRCRKLDDTEHSEHSRRKCHANETIAWNKDDFCRSECALHSQERFKSKRSEERKCCADHDHHAIERGRVEKNISKFNSNQDCWTMSK